MVDVTDPILLLFVGMMPFVSALARRMGWWPRVQWPFAVFCLGMLIYLGFVAFGGLTVQVAGPDWLPTAARVATAALIVATFAIMFWRRPAAR